MCMSTEVLVAFKEGKVAGYNGVSPIERPRKERHATCAWLDGHKVGWAMRRNDMANGTHPMFLELSRIHKRAPAPAKPKRDRHERRLRGVSGPTLGRPEAADGVAGQMPGS